MKTKDKLDECAESYIKLSERKQKKVDNWIKRNGCASFDFNNRDIILWDGGLFAIEKEIKIKPKQRIIFGKYKKIDLNGKTIKAHEMKFIPIRKKGKIINGEYEYYKVNLWFEELDSTIKRLLSMKRMLNKIGFRTDYKKTDKEKIKKTN